MEQRQGIKDVFFFLSGAGVADGVGGWRSYGVDPSQFPRSLMAACERLVKKGDFNPQQPVEILARGYEEIFEQKTPLIGMVFAKRFCRGILWIWRCI